METYLIVGADLCVRPSSPERSLFCGRTRRSAPTQATSARQLHSSNAVTPTQATSARQFHSSNAVTPISVGADLCVRPSSPERSLFCGRTRRSAPTQATSARQLHSSNAVTFDTTDARPCVPTKGYTSSESDQMVTRQVNPSKSLLVLLNLVRPLNFATVMYSNTDTHLTAEPLVQAQEVCFSYGRHPLFKGVSFTLPAGSITGLLGKNGEGKTTLLKLLSGLLLAKGGELSVLGHSSRKRSVPLLRELYYLPEEVQLPATSAVQYLDGAGQFYPNYDASLARQLLQDFDVPPTNNLRRLSMGQKKKVALVLALSLRVPLLLLDEPTNGLDIPSKSKFRQLLVQHISDEQTVLISTHQVRDLEQMIDRLVVLHQNQIICNETIAHLESTFYCGTAAEAPHVAPLYSEPSVWGEVVMTPRTAETAETGGFSMELFFNALMYNTQAVLQHLSQPANDTLTPQAPLSL